MQTNDTELSQGMQLKNFTSSSSQQKFFQQTQQNTVDKYQQWQQPLTELLTVNNHQTKQHNDEFGFREKDILGNYVVEANKIINKLKLSTDNKFAELSGLIDGMLNYLIEHNKLDKESFRKEFEPLQFLSDILTQPNWLFTAGERKQFQQQQYTSHTLLDGFIVKLEEMTYLVGSYQDLAKCFDRILAFYKYFRDELKKSCQQNQEIRQRLLNFRGQMIVDGVAYLVPAQTAARMLCKDLSGSQLEKKFGGNHAVERIAIGDKGLFCKPAETELGIDLDPDRELINARHLDMHCDAKLTTPSRFIKVSVPIGNEGKVSANMVQVSYGAEGYLLKDVLYAMWVIDLIKHKTVSELEAQKLFVFLFNEVSGWKAVNNNESLTKSIEKLTEQYISFMLQRDPIECLTEFQNIKQLAQDKEKQLEESDVHYQREYDRIKKHIGQLINDGTDHVDNKSLQDLYCLLGILKRHPALMTGYNLGGYLLQMPKLIRMIAKQLYPNTDPNIIFNNLPKLLEKVSSENITQYNLGCLSANPEDYHGGNLMLSLKCEEKTGQIVSAEIIAFDNDEGGVPQAGLTTVGMGVGQHLVTFKSVPHIYSSLMQKPIDEKVKKQFLSEPAEIKFLNYLSYLFAVRDRAVELTNLGVLTERFMMRETGKQGVYKKRYNVSLQANLDVLSENLDTLRVLDEALTDPKVKTQQDLFEMARPIVSLHYLGLLSNSSKIDWHVLDKFSHLFSDPYSWQQATAWIANHTIEKLAAKEKLKKFKTPPQGYKVARSVSLEDSLVEMLGYMNLPSMDVRVRLQVLDKIANDFPQLTKLPLHCIQGFYAKKDLRIPANLIEIFLQEFSDKSAVSLQDMQQLAESHSLFDDWVNKQIEEELLQEYLEIKLWLKQVPSRRSKVKADPSSAPKISSALLRQWGGSQEEIQQLAVTIIGWTSFDRVEISRYEKKSPQLFLEAKNYFYGNFIKHFGLIKQLPIAQKNIYSVWLIEAINNGNFKAAELLLSSGADVNYNSNNVSVLSALIHVINHGNEKVLPLVELVLLRNDIRLQENNAITRTLAKEIPANVSSEYIFKVLNLLSQAGENLFANGLSILNLAIHYKKPNLFCALVEQGHWYARKELLDSFVANNVNNQELKAAAAVLMSKNQLLQNDVKFIQSEEAEVNIIASLLSSNIAMNPQEKFTRPAFNQLNAIHQSQLSRFIMTSLIMTFGAGYPLKSLELESGFSIRFSHSSKYVNPFFCHDMMAQSFSYDVINYFKQIDIEQLLLAWVSKVERLQGIMQAKILFNTQRLENLFKCFWTIKQEIMHNPLATALDIMRLVAPSTVTELYERLFEKEGSSYESRSADLAKRSNFNSSNMERIRDDKEKLSSNNYSGLIRNINTQMNSVDKTLRCLYQKPRNALIDLPDLTYVSVIEKIDFSQLGMGLKEKSQAKLQRNWIDYLGGSVKKNKQIISRPSVTVLDLRNCLALTNEHLKAILFKNRQLRTLKLGNNPLLTDDFLADIARNCRWLKHLEIDGLSHSNLGKLESLNFLTHLTLANMHKLKDFSLLAGRLSSLTIQNCLNLNEKSINRLVFAASGLQALNFKNIGNYKVDYLIPYLLDNNLMTSDMAKDLLSHATKLDLGGTAVTNQQIALLAKHAPKLEELNLSKCQNINIPDLMPTLVSHCYSLSKIIVSSKAVGKNETKRLSDLPHCGDIFSLAETGTGIVAGALCTGSNPAVLLDFKGETRNILTNMSSKKRRANSLRHLKKSRSEKFGRSASLRGPIAVSEQVVCSDEQMMLPPGLQKGLFSRVFSVVALGNGNLVTGSRKGKCVLWDPIRNSYVRVINSGQADVTSLAGISNNAVASGSADNAIRILDTNTMRCLLEIRNANQSSDNQPCAVGALLFFNNYLYSGSENGCMNIWKVNLPVNPDDPLLQQPKKSWQAHNGKINAIIRIDEAQLASCGSDGKVILWNSSGKKIRELSLASKEQITAMTLLPNKQIAIGTNTGAIKIYDMQEDKVVLTYQTDKRVLSLAWTKHGLVSGHEKGFLGGPWSPAVDRAIAINVRGSEFEKQHFTVIETEGKVELAMPLGDVNKISVINSLKQYRSFVNSYVSRVQSKFKAESTVVSLEFSSPDYAVLQSIAKTLKSLKAYRENIDVFVPWMSASVKNNPRHERIQIGSHRSSKQKNVESMGYYDSGLKLFSQSGDSGEKFPLRMKTGNSPPNSGKKPISKQSYAPLYR